MVRIEDLREEEERPRRGPTILSPTLAADVADRIAKKEQVILFLNRRGHSPYVQCRHCGYVSKCSQCDVTLTYHRDQEALVCHYCGRTKENVQECEKCGVKLIKKFGRNGPFLACPNYPTCKFTMPLEEGEAPRPTGEVCPNCGSPMVIR